MRNNFDMPLLYHPTDFDSYESESANCSPVKRKASLSIQKFREEFSLAQIPSDPLKAALYAIANVFSFSVVQLFAKILFVKYPEMNEIQYLLLRSIVHTLIIVFVLNLQMKHVLWNGIPSDKIGMIAFRVGLGVLSFYFMFQGIRTLPLVEVALVTNLMPIFTTILSCYILMNETLKTLEKSALVVAFFGVFILIEGSKQTHS